MIPLRSSLICFLILELFLAGFSHGQDTKIIADLTSVKKRVQAVYERVSPSIVRFAYGNNRIAYNGGKFQYRKPQFGSGVIVTADGHIAVSGPVHAVIKDDLLDLRLADGRRVRGKALGWSSEFGFGLLKITEQGPWPHVELRDQGDVKAGEFCAALGYPRQRLSDSTDRRLSLRVGVVTQSAAGQWLTSSHRFNAGAHGVFDLDGKLIGLNRRTIVGRDPLHLSTALIKTHWEELVAGKNLDRARLHSCEDEQGQNRQSAPTNQLESQAAGKEEIPAATIQKAKAASVRISEIGEKKGVASGVIVTPDGYVITCAHHARLPGHKVKVSLLDGRDVGGVVLGTNRLADVGLIKITDEGTWPYTEMGHSATMQPGDRCVLIGFPNARSGPEPWTLETKVILPSQTLPRRDEWYCEFWTSGFPESLGGASGGGVFDTQGRVIAVLLGGAGDEMQHSRVELFRKQWNLLTTATPVDVVDAEWLAEITPFCNRITEEVLVDNQQ